MAGTGTPSFSARDRLLAVGFFAVAVVGIHAGADGLDDLCFLLLNFIDGLVDRCLVLAVESWGWVFNTVPELTERRILWAVDFIGLDEKVALSRVFALVVELVAIVVLAAPMLFRAGRPGAGEELKLAVRTAFRRPSFLRTLVPLVTLVLLLVGSVVSGRSLGTETYGFIAHTFGRGQITSAVARGVGGTAFLLTLYLAAVASSRTVLRAHRVSERLRLRLSVWRMRLVGLFTFAVGAPVALFALWTATPVGAWVRSLWL